ncbi:MAG: methylated-DNA--[protein]-cysteine S-methyltransferase [Spirochaetes bacterium]|nr:methylated-DNA--[protein]-cysteine S-methyltransferase [Spirochaetota bacterium]
MQLPTREIMYKALCSRDSQFDGIFFAAIRTTGIFCRPTCHAKKPKPENIEYYATIQEALQNGYRPCKFCQPQLPQESIPEWIKTLLIEISQNPHLRLKDYDLRQRGIEPATLRRWFLKKHGITFHAYQRLLRINQAFKNIKHGGKVSDHAFDTGYQSLSGFTDAFKKTTGISPNQAKDQELVIVTRISTPLGPMLAGANQDGLCLLEFTDRRMLETQIKRLTKLLKTKLIPGEHPLFASLSEQINQYFLGKRKKFEIPLVLPGSDFQKQVWQVLQEIPYGKTRSYQQQAIAIGNPQAVRAIARANGENRIAIIIPCHRVIGANGEMVGYGGGIWRKKYLLDLENKYNY